MPTIFSSCTYSLELNTYRCKFPLPRVEYGGGFLLVPADVVHLAALVPVFEHLALAHQLHHGLQRARTAQRRRVVARHPAHDQLFRPVHVRRREPEAPRRQHSRHVWNLNPTDEIKIETRIQTVVINDKVSPGERYS